MIFPRTTRKSGATPKWQAKPLLKVGEICLKLGLMLDTFRNRKRVQTLNAGQGSTEHTRYSELAVLHDDETPTRRTTDGRDAYTPHDKGDRKGSKERETKPSVLE